MATTDGGPLDLEAIKARADKAAPGPWILHDPNEGTEYGALWSVANDPYFNPHDDTEDFAVGIALDCGNREDAEFIAHAREDIPALIAEVERLRTELEAQRREHGRDLWRAAQQLSGGNR